MGYAQLGNPTDLKDAGKVIEAMLADVEREVKTVVGRKATGSTWKVLHA